VKELFTTGAISLTLMPLEDGEAFISGGEAGEGLDAYYKHLDTFGAVVAATAVDLRNYLLFILSPNTKVQAL
jgi:hypothetical protein